MIVKDRNAPGAGCSRIAKRLFDFAAALGFIVVFWWLMVIVWVLVCLDSPGPGLFRQVRVGRDEKPFVCYKFRTMYLMTPELGTHDVSAKSVTRVGSVLRRTKLDELPQLFNILANQMSLVGPRPCLPSQTELIVRRREKGVFEVLPGVTGLAQINGIDMSRPEILAQWDRRYIDECSFDNDLKILVQTALGGGQGDKTAA